MLHVRFNNIITISIPCCMKFFNVCVTTPRIIQVISFPFLLMPVKKKKAAKKATKKVAKKPAAKKTTKRKVAKKKK